MTLPTDVNGDFTELWLGKIPTAATAVAFAGYSHDETQVLYVADSTGQVRPLTIGPPDWQWTWRDPISAIDGIVGMSAYFHPGDNRHHCFVADVAGSIWEIAFPSFGGGEPAEKLWIGGWEEGVRGIAGYPHPDGSHQLFVLVNDGLVHPLELGSNTGWVWAKQEPVTTSHGSCTGLAAHYNPLDHDRHVFTSLGTGDMWESLIAADGSWTENRLGIQDGGSCALAAHAAPNGTQHIFAAGTSGWVLPLQIGPPYWRWRWDNRLMTQHGGIIGLVSYFHALDNVQHVFAALNSGDIWESRFQLRDQVATRDWHPLDFPISYWEGPLPEAGDLTGQFQQVADGGFTFTLHDISYGPDINAELLAAAGNAGLRMFVYDNAVVNIELSDSVLTKEKMQLLDQIVAAYSGHSALAGYFILDEVPPGRVGYMGAISAYVHSIDPGHTCFSEAYPAYLPSNYDPLSYPDYIELYVNGVGLPFLCFDEYAALSPDPSAFYSNLRVIRDKALAHSLPFWQFGQSATAPSIPSETGFRYQAMQIMAFGGKGVLWFTYRGEIVNSDGTQTSKYAEVQRVNAEIRTIGKYLLNARSTAVYELGIGSSGGALPSPSAVVAPLNAANNFTIGLFATDTATQYALVATRKLDNPDLLTVAFNANTAQRLDKTTDTWNDIDPSQFGGYEFKIDPGGAEFFRLT